ncbi:unnamed protein product [Rotaria magnacalcarata]|uniref:Hexosyltransferase n=4 Tax=Rotaria magnacalcarata TaxID=392030 RepID=A0A819L917_9BILA|nr:unnamed protein product [Rotaria magnacalcarata]CAF3960443.1 unnamed protein product [Rotaria magnacalcarata]
MPFQATLYQRIFHRDLHIPFPISHQTRYNIMRRNYSDRVCLCLSVLLLFYIGWYVLTSSNFTVRFRRDSAEELAYKNAIKLSSPMMENRQICSVDETNLILLIISVSTHFLQRQSIRETWGSMSDMFGIHSQRLFVIGYRPGGNLYKELSNEAIHEQDLLYLTVDDHSVTLKELHAYRWLEQYCSTAVYIFKTEDDLFVNSILLHELVRELKTRPNDTKNRYLYNISLDSLFNAQINSDASRFLFGWSFLPGRPERTLTNSQYYVTYQEYPNELYPRYCSGFGYLMNSKTRNALTKEALRIQRPFRFSDIFITGMMSANLNFICDTLPFTFHQGTTDECIELIRDNNKKVLSSPPTPVIICSTGLHTGQSSFNDYYKIWVALKLMYAGKLQTSNN